MDDRARTFTALVFLDDQPGAARGDAPPVLELVGEDGHHHKGNARSQCAEHGARPSVAHDDIGLVENALLLNPRFDMDVARDRAKTGAIEVATYGKQNAGRQTLHRVQCGPVDIGRD